MNQLMIYSISISALALNDNEMAKPLNDNEMAKPLTDKEMNIGGSEKQKK